MGNKQLALVSFEQAKRLKEAGFNVPCRMYYASTGRIGQYGYLYDDNQEDEGCSAPTVALALDYLRDGLGVPCAVEMLFRADTDGIAYQGRYVWAGNSETRTQAFGRHCDAASKLLDMILNEL